MSSSFTTVHSLLDRKETEAAARAFRGGLATQVKKLYTEMAETAPKRYLTDCNWNRKIKGLYKLTACTQASLDAGRIDEGTEGLAAIRTFFYALHKDNQMSSSGDLILELKRQVDVMKANGTATAPALEAIAALVDKIPTEKPPARMSAQAGAYEKDTRALLGPIQHELDAPSGIDKAAMDRMSAAANTLYARYGMDLE